MIDHTVTFFVNAFRVTLRTDYTFRCGDHIYAWEHIEQVDEWAKDNKRVLCFGAYIRSEAWPAIKKRIEAARSELDEHMAVRRKLESVLCDPEGTVCIDGSDGDRQIIQEALDLL